MAGSALLLGCAACCLVEMCVYSWCCMLHLAVSGQLLWELIRAPVHRGSGQFIECWHYLGSWHARDQLATSSFWYPEPRCAMKPNKKHLECFKHSEIMSEWVTLSCRSPVHHLYVGKLGQ
jgi:hypothetical protein